MGEMTGTGTTPLADVFAHVDRLRAMPDSAGKLLEMLAEQSPIYAGRGSREAGRLRGYVLASFERTGLPEPATAFVIEELQTGYDAYVVAAAGRAIRGATTVPREIVPLLLAAIERIRQSDDVVRFDRVTPLQNGTTPTTALTELFRTLAWLGPQADNALPWLEAMLARQPPAFSDAVCVEIKRAIMAISRDRQPASQNVSASCCNAGAASISPIPSKDTEIENVELQDQSGEVFTFGDFFGGRPSILAFFYTRCMNPNKCSLTITKLGCLQRRAHKEGLGGQANIAAVTFDPAFDLPHRLRAYGAERGLTFDRRTRLMRTTGPFDPLQQAFELGVGYGSTTVNQHRLDAVVFDPLIRPIAHFARVQWQEDEVLGLLKSALGAAVA
jgi:protein SCO1/2